MRLVPRLPEEPEEDYPTLPDNPSSQAIGQALGGGINAFKTCVKMDQPLQEKPTQAPTTEQGRK